jgi:hypothetical protein
MDVGSLALGMVGGWALHYLLSYLSEKGKNLATREDIGKMTDKIEQVRTDYATKLQNIEHQNDQLLERMRGEHQLRLAAAERRLQAHQDAWRLWRHLYVNVYSEEMMNAVRECHEWYDNNCLYLSAKARDAFAAAFVAARRHKSLLDERASADVIKENFKRIQHAPDAILAGAELPPLGKTEQALLDEEPPGAAGKPF